MLKYILCGLAGAAAGFAGATLMWKQKYQKQADEEVESMREYVNQKLGEKETKKESSSEKRESDLEELKEKIRPYSQNSGVVKIDKFKPYEIPEEDFVIEDEDFAKVSLEYYTESGLLYEGNEVVGDVNGVIGNDILDKLHGFSDDTLYVRNEKLETDYEVIKIEGVGPER